jgi:hypothetical protein
MGRELSTECGYLTKRGSGWKSYHFGAIYICSRFRNVEEFIDCTVKIDPRPGRDGLYILAALPVVALIHPLKPQKFVQENWMPQTEATLVFVVVV